MAGPAHGGRPVDVDDGGAAARHAAGRNAAGDAAQHASRDAATGGSSRGGPGASTKRRNYKGRDRAGSTKEERGCGQRGVAPMEAAEERRTTAVNAQEVFSFF